jgi:hypothetical protein
MPIGETPEMYHHLVARLAIESISAHPLAVYVFTQRELHALLVKVAKQVAEDLY